MGIRSTIAVAVKHNVKNDIPENIYEELFRKEMPETYEHTEGVLYVWRDMKWNIFDESIQSLYDYLETCLEDDYLVLVTNANRKFNIGKWTRNPWEVRLVVTEDLKFYP